MAVMLSLAPWPPDGRWGPPWAAEGDAVMRGLRGVVGLAGIYDFAALRDAHWAGRRGYEAWIAAAFGGGGWGPGSVLAWVREGGGEVRAGVEGGVVLAHSRGDEAVEWAQSEGLVGWLGGRAEVVEVAGGHDGVVDGGVEVARAVGVVVRALVAGRG